MLVLSGLPLSAGGPNLDSLRMVAQSAPEVSDRIFARNKLAFYTRMADREAAMDLLRESIAEAVEHRVPEGEGQACNHLGTIFQELRLADSAALYHRRALAIFSQTHNPKELGKTYTKLASVHHFQGLQDSAIGYSEAALKLFEPGSMERAVTQTNLGVYYRSNGDYEEAITAYIDALEWFDAKQLGYQAATTRNNIGVLFLHQERPERAQEYHEKALEWAREAGDASVRGGAATGLGNICFARSEWTQAEEYYSEALESFKALELPMEIGLAHVNIADVHVNLGRHSEAVAQYRFALGFFRDIEANDEEVAAWVNLGKQQELLEMRADAAHSFAEALRLSRKGTDPEIRVDLYAALSEHYERIGQADSALQFSRLHTSLKDSLFRVAQSAAIADVESRYQLGEKDKALNDTRNELDETSRKAWLLGAGILLSLGLLGWLLILLRRKQRRNRELQRQKAELLARFQSLENAYAEVLAAFEKEKARQESPAEGSKEAFPEYLTALSRRELEVLSCITIGMTDQEIADKLSVSVTTVRTHIRRIFSKLVVKNRAEAANLAFKYGLV